MIISGDPDGPEFISIFVKDKIRCKRRRDMTHKSDLPDIFFDKS